MIAGNTGGQAISLLEDSFCIKITGQSGNAYSWVRVERNKAHLWEETSERGSFTNDPAYEFNAATATTGQVYKAWRNPTSGEVLFFLRNLCTAPTDPGWPCALFAFHGILEYGYLDSSVGTINSSVVDKDSLTFIQEFRIKQFVDANGTLRQFRGASGWYFQAAASTAQARINTTANDERDTTNRSSWGDIVGAWTGGTNVKPISNLFMGLTTFGGYYYGSRDPDITGNINTSPGPIRLTYLYGDTNSYNNCQMQFELQSACKARLKGTTQAIPNWSSSGSAIPDSTVADISIKPGTDNFIILDGLRAIRIRPLGWLAHMADHAMKPYDTFTSFIFPGGMQMVWRESAGSFANDNGTPIGDYTEQFTEANGTYTYNNKIEIAGFHHKKFGDWCDTTLGAPDRYQLKARAKVWYKVSGSQPAQPDPYKVLMGTNYYPPDEVVEVQAQERKTVHTPPSGPPFNVPADYAHNPGFIFTFSQTVNNIAYLHITFHYNDQLIGSQYWGHGLPTSPPYQFPMGETYNNVVRFQKANNTDQITDDFSASLISQPFGGYANSPLPKSYIAVKQMALLGANSQFQIWHNVTPPSGTVYDIDWGDGSTSTNQTSLTQVHEYNTSGVIPVKLTVKPPTGDPYSHTTYIYLGTEWAT